VVGEPVRFRFFGSSVRRDDTSGTMLRRWTDEELVELGAIEATVAEITADHFVAGQFVDVTGTKVGEHAGTEHFTIGQRRGHRVVTGVPMYVVEVIPDEGLVVVGTEADCKARSMLVEDLNWIGFDVPASGEFRCEVQYRYHCVPAPATVAVQGERAEVHFDTPQMAVAPGQGAAFYRADLLLGGGWIATTKREGQAAPVAAVNQS